MTPDPKKLEELSERLDLLLRKQDHLQVDVNRLRLEIEALKGRKSTEALPEPQSQSIPYETPPKVMTRPAIKQTRPKAPIKEPISLRKRWNIPSSGIDLEKFIGENLISKIGILITVIGVAFGAKYAIDHEMISPLTRIILGYLAGVSLLGVAMRLKPKYENFSAVLLSGALAILYIITYFAYNYYDLFPQTVAFALMLLFTAFTVLAAWQYNRQIIALFGLVGAYAVPFLLSENSGQVQILFTYMAIVNGGILVIAFRKYWKLLYHTAFWFTWLIFSWWMIDDYYQGQDFATGLIFVSIFYLLFYGTFLAYKLIKKEAFNRGDIALLITNTFIFFGFGYIMLEDHPTGKHLLGAFAVLNAGIHFMVGRLLYRDKLADRNLFYFIIGLVLVFLTMAIPIQLDGNWVSLLWAGEAALLFWIGRSRQIAGFEKMALPLMLLAFGSLLQDWSDSYGSYYYQEVTERLRPIFNVQLLSSLIFLIAFGAINWMNQQKERFTSALPSGNVWRQAIRFIAPGIFLIVLYLSFRSEIEYYYQLRYSDSGQVDSDGYKLQDYAQLQLRNIWVINYTLVFLTLLSWANILRIKNRLLGWINLGLNVLALLSFLTIGLYELSELRIDYLTAKEEGTLVSSFFYLRYLGFAIVALLLYTTYRYQKQDFIALKPRWPFDLLLHLIVLWAASSELIHWMDISGSEQTYKLGLSILWGVYSLLVIALGIAQRKAYLRIGAMALFGITLVKLFFYDIADLNTMAKTIVLVSLGILLLLSSFLYNKFKDIIADEKAD